jgi:hypothetical protein
MPKKTKTPKPGLYNGMIDKVIAHKDGTVTVQMSLFGKGFKFTERLTTRPIKETIPLAGHCNFRITCNRFMVSTVIGADNQHHASNKATKLFGPHWSQVVPDSGRNIELYQRYSYISVKEFTELLRTLPN